MLSTSVDDRTDDLVVGMERVGDLAGHGRGARVPRGTAPLAVLSTSDVPLLGGFITQQHEVLELLADGLTNAEIAARLVLPVRIVDQHISVALTKLVVTCRRQAAAFAMRPRPTVAAADCTQTRYVLK
jgi:DNA-binding CsgD family transcriptional regulator